MRNYMLHYVSGRSLDDAVEQYNNAPGNKQLETIQFLPIQDEEGTSLAIVIIYTTNEQTAQAVAEPKKDRRMGPFIGQRE